MEFLPSTDSPSIGAASDGNVLLGTIDSDGRRHVYWANVARSPRHWWRTLMFVCGRWPRKF